MTAAMRLQMQRKCSESILPKTASVKRIQKFCTSDIVMGQGWPLITDPGTHCSHPICCTTSRQGETEGLIERLQEIDRRQTLILAFGEEDESYKIAGYELKNGFSEMEMHILKGAEHSLTTAQAMVLPELFFDRNALKKNGVTEVSL